MEICHVFGARLKNIATLKIYTYPILALYLNVYSQDSKMKKLMKL